MDELHDQQLQVPRIAAERRVGGLHPRHVAMMIGAPHVDLALEAALALVLVIGDVRSEIGVLAVGANQHAVLVVAVARWCAATALPRRGRCARPARAIASVWATGLGSPSCSLLS